MYSGCSEVVIKRIFFWFIYLFIEETIQVRNYSVDHCKVILDGKAQNVNWWFQPLPPANVPLCTLNLLPHLSIVYPTEYGTVPGFPPLEYAQKVKLGFQLPPTFLPLPIL